MVKFFDCEKLTWNQFHALKCSSWYWMGHRMLQWFTASPVCNVANNFQLGTVSYDFVVQEGYPKNVRTICHTKFAQLISLNQQ